MYQEKPEIAGLNCTALGIGIIGASQTSSVVTDKLYTKPRQKYETGKPEYRVCEFAPTSILRRILTPNWRDLSDKQVAFCPSVVLVPVWLLISGWTVECEAHLIRADIVGDSNLELDLSNLLNPDGVGAYPRRSWGYPAFQGVQIYAIGPYSLDGASSKPVPSFARTTADPPAGPCSFSRSIFPSVNR